MKATGLAPHPITGELMEVEVEIIDPVLIEKIQRGMINDFSFKTKPATPIIEEKIDESEM